MSRFDPLDVQVHLWVGIEDIRRRVEQVVEELGHQKCCPFVFLAAQAHLTLEIKVFMLQQLSLVLRLHELLLDVFQLLLKELDQVVVRLGTVGRRELALLVAALLRSESSNRRLGTIGSDLLLSL